MHPAMPSGLTWNVQQLHIKDNWGGWWHSRPAAHHSHVSLPLLGSPQNTSPYTTLTLRLYYFRPMLRELSVHWTSMVCHSMWL